MTMERLDFGIRPASYDDGYVDAPFSDRADIFRDVRTRQAIAMCLDRQRVVDTVLFGLVDVPDTYLPPDHPLYNPDVQTYPFDVTAATRLLDEIGWRDHDNDPSTPRQAVGVTGVPLGTPLQLTYLTTGATQRRQVSEILRESLAQCGIGVQVEYLPVEAFYAAGPTGPLFGRRFDLAEYAMGTAGIEPPCAWYTSEEIPTEANHWVGTNVTGYGDPAFDRSCREAGYYLPDEPEYVQKHREVQALFAENLPVVPLYPRLRIAAARPDMCHFSLDGTSVSALWNIEAFDYGAMCSP
ncbi:MAG: hypothetical protein D6770_01480 [Anaerolineae bacterium]|nr:MAG: hypothetical protein D6770_01480 [Anaerolineae bacterium]